MRSLIKKTGMKTRDIVMASLLFSFIFSGFTAFGFTSPAVYNESSNRVEFLFCFTLLLLVCIPVSYYLMSFFSRPFGKKLSLRDPGSTPCFIKEWGLLFIFTVLLWIVFWILFFPGYFSPDSMDSVFQAVGAKELRNHHPLAFTALVTPFVWLGNAIGNIEIGLGLFSLLTMVFFAAVCSYITVWIKSHTNSRKLFLFCIVFLVLNPLLIEYSHAALKDVWFAGFVVLFALNVANYLISPDKKTSILIKIGITGLFVCLFRGNGLFLIVPTLLVVSLCVKPKQSRVFATLSGCMVCYFLVTGPVYSVFNAKSAGFEEMVGIPLQQISRTLVDCGNVSKENEQFLEDLFDISEVKEVYDPYLVDPVKWSSGFDSDFLSENKFQFFITWWQIFLDNPKSYLEAWRDATLGYWFVGVKDSICTGAGYEWLPSFDQYSEHIEFPQDRHQNGSTIFEAVISIEEYNLTIEHLRSIPILSTFFNLAVPSWLFVFLAMFLFVQGRWKSFLIVLPFILLFFTMLIATPTYYAWHYILSSYLFVPIALSLFIYRLPDEVNETTKTSCSTPKIN